MEKAFLVTLESGEKWDESKNLREQEFWSQHEKFIDQLFIQHKVLFGGPLSDNSKLILVVMSNSESDVRNLLKDDPFIQNGILTLSHVDEWDIYLEQKQED